MATEITVALEDATFEQLAAEAAEAGVTPEKFLHDLAREKIGLGVYTPTGNGNASGNAE